MWNQVNKFTIFSHPSCLLQQVFSQSTIVWRILIYSPRNLRRAADFLTALKHLWTHFPAHSGPLSCTAARPPTVACWPNTQGQEPPQTQAGWDSFQAHHTEEFQCQSWGVGSGHIKTELQIPHELDLCQQIKMFFLILLFSLYLEFLQGHFLNLKRII